MNPFDPYGLIDGTIAAFDAIHTAKIVASRPEPEDDESLAELHDEYEQNGKASNHA